MLLALGVACIGRVLSQLGESGVLSSLGVVWGELVGGLGAWGSVRELEGKGNFSKEVDPETAVCRLTLATASFGDTRETAVPC